MTIFARLGLWLCRNQPALVPEPVPAPVQPTFAERYAAYQDACTRKDTRAQCEAWQLLKDARTAQLEAERAASDIVTLNRAIGWRGGR